jgi:hypothetical protein
MQTSYKYLILSEQIHIPTTEFGMICRQKLLAGTEKENSQIFIAVGVAL